MARWRGDIQNDFQARMDWCITPKYGEENHNPLAIFNGDSSNEIMTLEIIHGAENYPNNMIEGTLTSEKIQLTVPEDFQKGQEVRIILRVSDTRSPSLVDYRRVVVYF